MRTNSATEGDDASRTPTQPITVTYFNRTRPVPVDHYLHREESDGVFLVMVAAALIAAAVILMLD
jgi:hypothetical protein